MSELIWIKSSFSEEGGNNCVELASLDGDSSVALRESEHPEAIVAASPAALHTLLRSIKTGYLSSPHL